MAYNMTELQETETVYQLIQYANTYSSGLLVGLFTVAIFIVLIMALKRYDFGNALITSSFITAVISSILAYIGLVNIYFPIAYISITAFTALFLYTRKD